MTAPATLEPRNILIVTEVFDVGGLETHIGGMVSALRAEGCAVHMAVGRRTGPTPPELTSFIADLPFDANAPVGAFVAAVDELTEFVRRHDIHVIHAHPFLSMLPALLVAERTRIPLAVTLHGPASLDVAYGLLHNQIVKSAVLPSAARIYGVSPEVLGMAQRFAAPDLCRLLPNGVDLARFVPPPTPPATDRWVIISRLDGPKIEGLKDFCTKAAAIGFGPVDIVGGGPAEGALAEHLAQLGVADRFRFVGVRHDVHRWLGEYAGVIGMGRVALEGAASNRPIVLVGYDGVKGLLDDRLATEASRSNLSGRGLATISAEALAGQLDALGRSAARHELRAWVAREHDEREIWRRYLGDVATLVASPTGAGERLEQVLRAACAAPESYLRAPAVAAEMSDACAETALVGMRRPAAAEGDLATLLRDALADARRHDVEHRAMMAAHGRVTDTLAKVTGELRQVSAELAAAEREVERLTGELGARDAALVRTEADLTERVRSVTERLAETDAALMAQTAEREALEYVVRRRSTLDEKWEDDLAQQIERTKGSRRYRIGNILATIPEKPLVALGRGLRWITGRYKARGAGLAEALEVWDPLADLQRTVRKGPRGALPAGLDPLAIRFGLQRARTAPWHGFAWQVPGLVSVVVPVLADDAGAAETIESVLAQTHPDVEILVVDDGRTDALAAYRGRATVRLLRQRQQGFAAALSNGFELARGEFWTWVSPGNVMDPRQLERLVDFLRRTPEAAMAYAAYRACDAGGESTIHPPDDAAALHGATDNPIGPCFLYRGQVGRLLGDYAPFVGVEVLDYWLRISALYPLRRLEGDEALHVRRVAIESPGARGRPGVVRARLEHLRADEPIRQRYYVQGRRIFIDDITDVRLAGLPLDPHVTAVVDPSTVAMPSGDDYLFLVHPTALEQLAARALPAECVVVVWFDVDDRSPYRYGAELQRLAPLCLVADTATAERCALFTRRVLHAPTPREAVALATAYASNDLWTLKTIPEADRDRTLPDVVRPAPSPLRVLLEVNHFDAGGLERVVLDLAVLLQSEGVEVVIAVLGRPGRAADEARRKGFDVVGVPEIDRETAYDELLVRRRIDLVNAHFSLAGAPFAAARGIPFVQTIHNTYVWFSAGEVAQYQAADLHTTAYVCVSPAVAGDAEARLGLPPAKLVVIPNGIDVARVDAARERVQRAEERQALGWKPNEFVLLCAASVAPPKAQLHLVRALALARRDVPHLRVALLGDAVDPEYAGRVEHEVRALGLTPVVDVLGYSDDPQRFYFLADAFVLPSFIEGWSLALAEALYAGLPVLSTDVGAARELLAETGGRLLGSPLGALSGWDAVGFGDASRADQPGFVVELAAALVALARDPAPPLLSHRLADSFDRDHALRAYVRLFRGLVSGEPVTAARPVAWELRAGGRIERGRTARPTTAVPRRSQTASAFEPGDRRLDEVLARMDGRRGVVFLSSIQWNSWLFQRPQQLARYFARLGHPTVYDDTKNRAGFVGFREIEPNLFLFRGDADELAALPEPLLWAFCYNYHLRDGFAPSCPVVYDVIDHPSVHFRDPTINLANHRRAVQEATVVAYVAKQLETLLEERPDRLYLPNGVDEAHFADRAIRLPLDREMHRIVRQRKPIAAYYGALAEWFDYALLERTATLRPDWNFVLIGQRYDDSVLGQTALKLPNVTWLGPRDYAVLPAYLRLFDVAMIPFCINDITLATSPLKLYEYFAGGRPVVTTPMPECMAFPEVTIVRTAEEFAGALEPARRRGQDPAFQAKLRRIAREHSWAERVRTVVRAYEAALAARRALTAAATDVVAVPFAEDPSRP